MYKSGLRIEVRIRNPFRNDLGAKSRFWGLTVDQSSRIGVIVKLLVYLPANHKLKIPQVQNRRSFNAEKNI